MGEHLKQGTSLELVTCARSASRCTAKRWNVFIREANVEPENTCCTCYYHDAKSWFCYNGLSPKGTENTDPEDTCEFYEKRNECES